jgi:hypothetical protein
MLAKQIPYHLTHISSLFYFGYFGDGGLMNYFLGLAWSPDPPDFCLLSGQDYKGEPPVHIVLILKFPQKPMYRRFVNSLQYCY